MKIPRHKIAENSKDKNEQECHQCSDMIHHVWNEKNAKKINVCATARIWQNVTQ